MRASKFQRWSLACAAAVLTVVCAAPTAGKLFANGYPATDDGLDHQVRFTAFALAIERGDWFPRWTAPLAMDYGSPIFTFYAPLSYYVGEAFHAAGFNVDDSLRGVFASGLIVSALTMFLLGREAGGNACGIVAGVLYAALPYQLHDVYTRGAIAESMALALLPLPAFAILRYTHTGRRRWIVLQAVGIAALILTHNISALLAVVGLICFSIAAATTAQRGPDDPARPYMRTLGNLAVGGLFGAALATFFWVPALAETGYIHADRMTVDVLDVHRYFNRAWPPWQTSWAFDYRFDRDNFPVLPGLVQVALAAFGVAALAVTQLRKSPTLPRYWLWLLPTCAVLLLALQRPGSAALWEHVPLARYVQFPYRLMGLFGLVTALLSGLGVASLPFAALRGAVAAAFVACSLWASLSNLHPTYTSGLPEDFGARSVLQTEAAMGELAGTTQSAEVPRWVTLDAREVIASVTRVRNAPILPRVASEQPFSARVLRVDDTAITVSIHAAAPTTLVLRQFYFPNWRAMTGQQQLATHAVGPLGLLAVDAPAGDTQVDMDFGTSFVERISAWLSLVAMLGLVWWLVFPRARPRIRTLSAAIGGAGAFLLAIAFVAVSLPSFGHTGTVLLPVEPRELAPGYQLAGVERPTTGKIEERTLSYTLHILAQQSGADLLFELDTFDERGGKVAGVLERPWNGSTTVWTSGELAPARLELSLPGGLPSEQLHSVITVYDARQPAIPLSTVNLPPEVVPPTPPVAYHPLATDFAATMAIRGYKLGRPEQSDTVVLAPGQTIDVTLDLQSLKWMGEDQTVFVHLLDSKGKLRAQHDELAGGKERPTSKWVSGEPVRQRFPILVPPDTAPGTYRLEAGFYQLATLKRLVLVDPLGKAQGDSLMLETAVEVR